MNQLFTALNSHDQLALAALLPIDDAGWNFEVQPDILAAANDANASQTDVDVTTHRDLDRILDQFAGLHLVFTGLLHGGLVFEMSPGSAGRPVVAIGPVLWRGTGPVLTQRGKTAVLGGGKTAVDCTTGLFSRVLLGPLRYEP